MTDPNDDKPHPLAGRKQALEHIEKRKASVAAAKAAWTPERREAFRQRCRETNAARKLAKQIGAAAGTVSARRVAARPVTIYGIADPRSGELRYIGQTALPLQRRMATHSSNVKRGLASHKYHWLREIASAGLVPEALILEVVAPGDDWVEAETFWISYFRFLGAALVNSCAGGQGTLGIKFTKEHRERLRASHLGKKRTPEHNAKMAEIHRRAWANGRPRGWTAESFEKNRRTRAERAAAGVYRGRRRKDQASDSLPPR